MFKKVAYLVLIFGIGLLACQKEYSFEGNLTGQSAGTLKDSSGNCQQIVVAGKYEMDTALNTTNYVLAKVNFTATGKWLIKSDSVNGVWFIDSGYTTTLGEQTLKIQGYGKPILPIFFNLTLYYNTSSCTFTCNSSVPIIRDYFPTTQNSFWVYYSSTIRDSMYASVLPTTTTINGLVYDRLELYTPLTNTRDTLPYRKDGAGNYYRYFAVTTGPNRDYIFLKDNVAVGTTWESPIVNLVYLGIPTQAKLKFSVLERNVMATVNSRTFDSVIKIKEEWQYLISGSFQTVNTNEHWFAKNIGQINFVQVNPLSPQTISIRRWRVY